ncbi:MAG TPA: rhodanese-like domain-containing protein [Chloroflexia bacterium]|nr:rhodanese-like domain-containing protein [Chloroflexia bacterium]
MWQPTDYTPPPLYRPGDVKRRLDAGEVAVLDVREPDEWDEGHIPGAHWIPLGELEDRFAELDPGQEWVCVCHLGQRSAMAAELLQQEGLRAANLAGGMAAWEQQALPIETGRGTPPAAHP